MDEIFLLEDDPKDLELAKEMLSRITGRRLSFQVAQSVQEAEAILNHANPGTFSLLLFDLLVPREQRARVDRNRDLLNGLEAVRSAWNAGHRSGVFILSQLMDNTAVRSAALKTLKEEQIEYADCLEKTKDLEGLDSWSAHFAPSLEDLRPITELLRKETGLLIVHRAQENLLRQFLERFRRGLLLPQPRLDCLLLRGEAGAGKSFWAKSAAWLKGWLTSDPGELAIKAPFDETSLSSFSSEFTDTDRLKLFGGRDYNQRYSDGVFVNSSYYPSRIRGSITRLDPEAAMPDRRRGGIALIDEFMSANPATQDSMLQVLENGLVEVIGANPCSYRVACTAVFASNLELVVRSGGAGKQRGEVGGAFRSRLGAPLHIPSLKELGWQATHQILLGTLERRLENPREISPAALELLSEVFEEGLLSMRTLRNLIEEVKSKRITPGAIQQMSPRNRGVAKSPISALTREVEFHPKTGEDWRQPRLLPIDEEALRKGEELWEQVRATAGRVINNDILKVVNLLEVSPQILFSMLLVGYASLKDEAVSQEDFNAWLGLSEGNALRNKLKTLGGRHTSLFSGSGKGGHLTIKDLEGWLVKYRVQRDATLGK